MKSIDKLLLSVYLLALTALFAVFVVITFRPVPYGYAINVLDSIFGTYKWGYLLGALLLILLNIKLLIGLFIGDKIKRLGVVRYTAEGEINISFDTIKSLVLKTAGGTKGIRDMTVMVKPGKENINIYIKTLILPDTNIPQTVKDMQDNVKTYIQAITEIPVGEVRVMVMDVASSTKLRVE
jgi:uncharacterized alkaline shock family protein YloU